MACYCCIRVVSCRPVRLLLVIFDDRPVRVVRIWPVPAVFALTRAGSVESAWAIAPGHSLVSLSEQQLVSCDDTTNDGCDGGWPYAAIDWFVNNTPLTEASYPDVSGGGNSPSLHSWHVAAPTNVTGWRLVPGNTTADVEEALAAWLAAYGPVSILVDAMTQRKSANIASQCD